MEKNIRITMIGEMDQIPKETARVLQAAIDDTKANTGMILNFAMNYGGRREIVLAAQAYARDVRDGKASDTISDEQFGQYLMARSFRRWIC